MARKQLPTSVPIPVDPQFEPMFIQHGWQKVERTWGKRRVQTWAMAVGKQGLIARRRDYLAQIRRSGQ